MSLIYDHVSKDHEVYGYIDKVVASDFPVIAGLTTPLAIKVSLVHSDKPDQVVLKKGGFPCTALISIVSEENREADGPDVLIKIDRDEWNELSDKRKTSLIAHELRHLDFPGKMKGDEGGWQPELDSLDRPKCKLLSHDFELGGFWDIIDKYSEDAPEKAHLNSINERLRQASLPFNDPSNESSLTIADVGEKLRKQA